MEVFFIESAPVGVAEVVWNVQMSLSLNHSLSLSLCLRPSISFLLFSHCPPPLSLSLSHCLFLSLTVSFPLLLYILTDIYLHIVLQTGCDAVLLQSKIVIWPSFQKIMKNFGDEKHLIEISGTALHWYSLSFTITYRLRTTTSCHSFDKIYSH